MGIVAACIDQRWAEEQDTLNERIINIVYDTLEDKQLEHLEEHDCIRQLQGVVDGLKNEIGELHEQHEEFQTQLEEQDFPGLEKELQSTVLHQTTSFKDEVTANIAEFKEYV